MAEPNWRLAGKRAKLSERARIMQMIRAFFIDHGYLEVETPHRVPGNAPEAYIEPETSGDWFLHTSPELLNDHPALEIIGQDHIQKSPWSAVGQFGNQGRSPRSNTVKIAAKS